MTDPLSPSVAALNLLRFLTIVLGVLIALILAPIAAASNPWQLPSTALIGLAVIAAGATGGSSSRWVRGLKWGLLGRALPLFVATFGYQATTSDAEVSVTSAEPSGAAFLVP